jgi:hypothetical protein
LAVVLDNLEQEQVVAGAIMEGTGTGGQGQRSEAKVKADELPQVSTRDGGGARTLKTGDLSNPSRDK